jgi:hypothetical protein
VRAGIWHVAHFEALRPGAMRAIDPAAIEGLVTFPSFHTALAMITAWALLRTRWLAAPAAALNALVVASTVPVGGHYFLDVPAGLAIAAGVIGVLGWCRMGLPLARPLVVGRACGGWGAWGRSRQPMGRRPPWPAADGQELILEAALGLSRPAITIHLILALPVTNCTDDVILLCFASFVASIELGNRLEVSNLAMHLKLPEEAVKLMTVVLCRCQLVSNLARFLWRESRSDARNTA